MAIGSILSISDDLEVHAFHMPQNQMQLTLWVSAVFRVLLNPMVSFRFDRKFFTHDLAHHFFRKGFAVRPR
jgi:hypothetical protein